MTDETPEGTVIGEVTTKYSKSALCRVIHADGVWGGLTPAGNIQMDLYSEKHTFPDSTTYDVVGQPGATIGALKEKQVVGGGHNREVEAEIILSPAVARSTRDWLEDKLVRLEAAQKPQASTP
jgi:hypothetical protein